MKLIPVFITGLLACFAITAAAADNPVPVIEKEQIVFINNKVMPIKPYHVLHKTPLDAYRNHEPIYYKEKAVLIEIWQRIIVSKHMNFFEGPRAEMRVYDYHGKLLNPATPFRGKVIISSPTKRIFVGQRSRSYKIEKSLLLDSNGKLIAHIPHSDGAYDFGMSPDGRLIVIYALSKQNNQTVIIAKVVDHNGRDVRTLDVSQSPEFIIDHDNEKYKFAVPTTTQTKAGNKKAK